MTADSIEGAETETVEIELDPARSLMLRAAREAGGPIAEEYLVGQVRSTVEEMYDDRERLAAARAKQSQAEQSDESATVPKAGSD